MDDKYKTGRLIKDLLKSKNLKQKDVAEFLGIKPPSLSQMLNGKIPFPQDKFLKIVNLAAPGSKKLEELKKLYFGSMAFVLSGSPVEKDKDEARPVRKLTAVPVISFAQAAGYEPALEPVDDYARDCSDETAMFSHEIRPGYFALNVEGDSMSPDFPHGTVILVAGGEFPQRGDIVVAKLRDGQVVVKHYFRRNNTICLDSINPSGKNFEWHCKDDPGFIQWMYPVLEATIDLRKRRWEKSRVPINYDPNELEQQYAVAEDDKQYTKE